METKPEQKPDFEKEAAIMFPEYGEISTMIRNLFINGANYGYHSRDKEVEELKAEITVRKEFNVANAKEISELKAEIERLKSENDRMKRLPSL